MGWVQNREKAEGGGERKHAISVFQERVQEKERDDPSRVTCSLRYVSFLAVMIAVCGRSISNEPRRREEEVKGGGAPSRHVNCRRKSRTNLNHLYKNKNWKRNRYTFTHTHTRLHKNKSKTSRSLFVGVLSSTARLSSLSFFRLTVVIAGKEKKETGRRRGKRVHKHRHTLIHART